MPGLFAFGVIGCVLANQVEEDTSLLQVSKKSEEVTHKLMQRSGAWTHASETVQENELVKSMWGKNPTSDSTTTNADGSTSTYTCDMALVGKCFKGHSVTAGVPSPSGPNPSPSPSGPSPSPGPPSNIPAAFPATSKFSQAQTSFFTGKAYSERTEVEQKIADQLNKVRQEGFTCKKSSTDASTVTYQPAPNKLKFDCRLWWTSVLHSEDMTVRKYYSHYTKAGSYDNKVSGESEQVLQLSPQQRSEKWAWGMPSHVEIILAYPVDAGSITDADYAQKVVQAWLDSPAHCNGIATAANQLVGVGGVWCPKSGQDSVCTSTVEADADGTGRWYWTAMFTYDLPAASGYVKDDYSIKGQNQPVPRIREIGDDQSCFA